MACTVSPWENGEFTADLPGLAQARSRLGITQKCRKTSVRACCARAAVLALLPLQLTSEAQEQAPSGERRGDYAMSAYERMADTKAKGLRIPPRTWG
jgi:hypothetical protein